jgi:NhaP-type Na+/H+ or K+/H+ antiporter
MGTSLAHEPLRLKVTMQQWFLLVGGLLVAMALTSSVVRRLPLSPAMLYLAVGIGIGPDAAGWLNISLTEHAAVVELLAEIAVLVTLFSVGMRLRPPAHWRLWNVPLRLATLGMVVTTVLAAAAAYFVLDLPWPAALLLAAIMAPTDPVLASELQIRKPGDRDAVRLALTAEGGMNDGSAFPALMLALGLLGTHELGPSALRWVTVDLLWATAGGVAVGWLSGSLIAAALRRLQRSGRPVDLVEFLVLGIIALTYGLALALHTYGFLAVFAGGLALGKNLQKEQPDPSATPHPTALPSRVMSWTAQSERICEVTLVLLVGVLLGSVSWNAATVGFTLLLLFVVRPLAVLVTSTGSGLVVHQRRLVAWFGIRGIGSLYYLAFALDHGVPIANAAVITDAALIAIATSIALHGISATPLMEWYERRRRRA